MKTLNFGVAFSCVLLFGAARLHAQTNYAWNSTAGGTYTTAANWTPNGTPGSADSIITPTGTPPGNLTYVAGTQGVTNWTFSPGVNENWETIGVFSASSTLNISGTLTENINVASATGEMIYVDGSSSGSLTMAVGAISLNNGRLYLGGATGSVHSITVSGLTTIGNATTNTATSRLEVTLDTLSGAQANFQGGVAFGAGATSAALAEDFYFNTSGISNSASVGFLSGGTTNAIVEGDSTASVTSTLILTGNSGSSGDSGTNSFAGIIQDTAAGTNVTAVQKTGNDTQIFSGVNTYTGGTIINGGNLQLVNLTGSGTGTGGVALSGGTGTTVSGTGTSTGLLTVTAGSRIAPGVNTTIADGSTRANFGVAGTLTLGKTGGMTLTSVNLDLDLSNSVASGNDLIATGGTLTLESLAVNINELNGTLVTGTNYTLISGATAVSGFNASNITTTFLDGTTYTPTYSLSGDNLDVSFAAVPEPSAWTAEVCCLGMVALVLRRRFARA